MVKFNGNYFVSNRYSLTMNTLFSITIETPLDAYDFIEKVKEIEMEEEE